MKYSFIEFCRNIKSEILAIILYIFVSIIGKFFISSYWDLSSLLSYFTQDRLNGIAAFFAIAVGVYVAVVTVFATSKIGISREMLKRNLDKPLINVVIVGMIEDIITVGLSIFIPINKITVHILIIFLMVSVISFGKFILLLIIIFRANMNEMAKEIDAEEEYNDELLSCLKEILNQLKR